MDLDEKNSQTARDIISYITSNDPVTNMRNKIGTPFLRWLLAKVIEIMKNEPNIIRLSGYFFVIGDIHGQLDDLCEILKKILVVNKATYVFLGDYVDRGKDGLEVITLLFCLKYLYPDRVYLLRGNHESKAMTASFGFKDECIQKLNEKTWENFTVSFCTLPLAAILNQRILCIHGGISPSLEKLEQIEKINRFKEVPDNGLFTDLLWTDPNKDTVEFQKSVRGDTFFFGEKPLRIFLERNKLDTIMRGHEVVINGFDFPFLPYKGIITIFSASCYSSEADNKAAYASVTPGNVISFEQLPLAGHKLRCVGKSVVKSIYD